MKVVLFIDYYVIISLQEEQEHVRHRFVGIRGIKGYQLLYSRNVIIISQVITWQVSGDNKYMSSDSTADIN